MAGDVKAKSNDQFTLLLFSKRVSNGKTETSVFSGKARRIVANISVAMPASENE